MKFNFLKIPCTPSPAFPDRYSVIAPIIPVCIINPDDREKYIDIKALIDSGADVSIFPKGLGDILGIEIVNDKKLDIKAHL